MKQKLVFLLFIRLMNNQDTDEFDNYDFGVGIDSGQWREEVRVMIKNAHVYRSFGF